MEDKRGVLTEIIFNNEANGYTIAVMETDDEQITVVGELPPAAKGACFQLRGEFRQHPKYGEQFVFSEAREVMPESELGIEAFLASGVIRGVGPKMATAIVKKFGKKSLDILGQEPRRLLEVEGIGEKKLATIATSFAEHREFADVSVQLQEYGITSGQALKLYKTYGSATIDALRENPYRIIEDVRGIGFSRADEIASKLGVGHEDSNRVKSGISYGIRYFAAEGHTFVPMAEFIEACGKMLDVPRDLVKDALLEMALDLELRIDMLGGGQVVYGYPLYMAERDTAISLKAIKDGEQRFFPSDMESSIALAEARSGISLSDEQRAAVRSTLESNVTVITGGPGTGKTTIINAIIEIFEGEDTDVVIAAPTGRAAKRITETSGHDASTIHRLLEYSYRESSDEMEFKRNRENPLTADVVVIDEASMVDILLMKSLTEAIMPGTKLILLGDADQLPSVGPGNVLRDLIESEFVNTIRLTKVFRQAEESMIVVNAHRINRGEIPALNSKDKDFFFVEKRGDQYIQEAIIELLTKRLPGFYTDLDMLKDAQVLSPTKKGPIGTVEMNKALQEALNPAGPDKAERQHMGRTFRVGDKVMQMRNNYDKEWVIPGQPGGEGIFNGDVGTVMAINSDSGLMTVLFDDTRYVTYEFQELEELELAYCVTVHKSQGSEFPVIIMPVTYFNRVLGNRNLLYTAVTRGKTGVILVGEKGKLVDMVNNDYIKKRYSGLGIRLKELLFLEERE